MHVQTLGFRPTLRVPARLPHEASRMRTTAPVPSLLYPWQSRQIGGRALLKPAHELGHGCYVGLALHATWQPRESGSCALLY